MLSILDSNQTVKVVPVSPVIEENETENEAGLLTVDGETLPTMGVAATVGV